MFITNVNFSGVSNDQDATNAFLEVENRYDVRTTRLEPDLLPNRQNVSYRQSGLGNSKSLPRMVSMELDETPIMPVERDSNEYHPF